MDLDFIIRNIKFIIYPIYFFCIFVGREKKWNKITRLTLAVIVIILNFILILFGEASISTMISIILWIIIVTMVYIDSKPQ